MERFKDAVLQSSLEMSTFYEQLAMRTTTLVRVLRILLTILFSLLRNISTTHYIGIGIVNS